MSKDINIRLGGFPLVAQRFSWAFKSGMEPYELALTFPAPTATLIGQKIPVGTFIDLDIKHTMFGFAGTPQKIKLSIKDLILLAPDATGSPWDATWKLADQRYVFQGQKHSSTYNLRRETNDRGVVRDEKPVVLKVDADPGLVPADQMQVIVKSTVQGDANREFARWGKQNYLPWTVKAIGEPYEAFDICQHIAGGLAARTGPVGVVGARLLQALRTYPDGFKNKYVESDVRMEQEDVPAILDEWLEKAEMGLALNPDGSFYVYSLFRDEDLNKVIAPFPPPIQGGGNPARQELHRIRAAEVLVSFPKEVEQLFEAKVPWSGAAIKRPTLLVQNVVRLPDDITYLGKKHLRGTWMQIDDAMAAWSTQLPIPGNLYSKPPLNDEKVRQLWFPSGYLMQNYGMSLQNEGGGIQPGSSRRWGPRISSLMQNYRQTWRINPVLMPYILEWSPTRLAIIDAVTRTRAAAYVSADHLIIPEVGIAEFKQNRNQRAGINITGRGDDVLSSGGAPAQISVLDPAQGIFKVDWIGFNAGEWYGQIVPSQVVDAEIPWLHAAKAGTGPNEHGYWDAATLKEDYKAFFIFSVRYGTRPPPGNPRLVSAQKTALFYTIRVPVAKAIQAASQVGAKAPEVNPQMTVEIVSREDTARFEWKKGKVDALPPVNMEVLSALATAKAQQYYFSMRDRLLGRFTVPGWSDAYRLFGAMRSLSVTIDEDSVITTTFDFTAAPKPRELYHLLPKGVRQTVYRELPRARKDR